MSEFNIGDRVEVIRHRHGWDSGATGEVTEKYRRSGGAAYYVVTEDEFGCELEVRHSNDLREE